MAKIIPPKYFMQNRWARWVLSFIDFFFSLILNNKKQDISLPKKILISHPAHIGDVILMTSLLEPIKKNFPEIKIGVIVGSHSRMVVDGHPLIDWIHTVDHFKLNRNSKKRFLKYFRTRNQALKEIKKVAYDISVDCNFHYPNLASLFWQAKIPCRIGFITAGFSPFLTHKITWKNINQSAAYFYLSLLKVIPKFTWRKPLKPFLHISREVLKFPKQSYIVVHMGSGNSIKEWPLENWKVVLEHLKNEQIIFTGKGKKEKEAILSVIQPEHIDLCDKLSWNELLSLIKYAKQVLSVDTSVGHIAGCFDVPTQLLFTGIYPSLLWKPLSEKVIRISKSVSCSPCFNGRGCESMVCIRSITLDKIINGLKG